MALVGLEGKLHRIIGIDALYKLDGEEEYVSRLEVVPSTQEIRGAPEFEACSHSGRRVPADCLSDCAVTGARVLRHLLVASEVSGRLALPEFVVVCGVSGQRLLQDECEASSVTGRLVSRALLTTSDVTGKRAEPVHFGECEFTGARALADELAVSEISGKRFRADQMLRISRVRRGRAQE